MAIATFLPLFMSQQPIRPTKHTAKNLKNVLCDSSSKGHFSPTKPLPFANSNREDFLLYAVTHVSLFPQLLLRAGQW